MKAVFADTGYWIALVNHRDDLSVVAKAVTKKLFPLSIVTSEIVLGELLNSFSKKDSFLKQVAIKLIDRTFCAYENYLL